MTDESELQAHTPDPKSTAPAYRVKLYQLNVDTNWEDKGTGFCTYQKGSEGKQDLITVHSESDDRVLLTSHVLKRRLYQRQQDTLIVWTEDDNRDLALSFQDPTGCEEIWQLVNKKQGNEGILADTDSLDDTPVQCDSPEMTTLPDPELSKLQEILDTLRSAHTLHEKDKLSSFITAENYLEKLFPIFETAEDMEDIADLHILYNIIIAILSLNDQGLFELLVRDEFISNFMGILEYNPRTPSLKAKHREFIKTRGQADQVVQLKEEIISKKVDQTFRLEYLQSVLRNEESDDVLMGILNNMIFQNHVEIVNFIQNNHEFLNELMKVIKDKTLTEQKRLDTIKFIHQIYSLTKQMQNSVRLNLLRSLANYGLFDLLSYALKVKTPSVHTPSLNILAAFTDLDVTTVRSHLLSQVKEEHKEEPLLQTIIEQFSADDFHDLKVQYFEIVRLLLDPNGNSPTSGLSSDPLNKQTPETDEFLQYFYDNYTKTLLNPLESLEIKPISIKGPVEPLDLTQDQAQLYLYLCEFLYFAVKNHGFRSKFIFLSSDLFGKVAQLYRSKYAYVKLCALRFFRVCLTMSDEFYQKTLIKHNVFEPTIRVLLDTNGRDCLLNSACLELLEYIRKESIKPLISHIMNQFGTVLDTITYISTCKQLRIKYDQYMEKAESTKDITDESTSGLPSDKKANHDGWSSSTVDEDEEEYFNGSDEEEETRETPKTTNPLVPYDDDDEESGESEESEDLEEAAKEDKTLKRKAEEDDNPPPFKSRKTSDDEEEDDILAKKSPRRSPLNKKIVIKTTMKKMHSQ